MTPLVRNIAVTGNHWCWDMSGITILGAGFAPTFTELMVFDEARRIDFSHDPPDGQRERTGVEGWYALEDTDEGTRLAISLGVVVDLKLSRLAAPGVEATMRSVIAKMGRTYSANLLAHLGLDADGSSRAPGRGTGS